MRRSPGPVHPSQARTRERARRLLEQRIELSGAALEVLDHRGVAVAFGRNPRREQLVDERAVADALRSGKLGGFGADVVAAEPMRSDNPLLGVRDLNIAITPHIAWGTREARARLLDEVARNIEAFLEGRPRNIVK